ncbi:MAG: hypothetical protein ACYS0C_07830 [Planctomycetota bacterium]
MNRIKNDIRIRATHCQRGISPIRRKSVLINAIIIIIEEKLKLL